VPDRLVIYKVKMNDDQGIEIAVFGYYEDKDDALKRRKEIAQKIHQVKYLEIECIEVIPKTIPKKEPHKVHYDTKDFYDVKD